MKKEKKKIRQTDAELFQQRERSRLVLLSSCLSWALADEAEDEKVVGVKASIFGLGPPTGPHSCCLFSEFHGQHL